MGMNSMSGSLSSSRLSDLFVRNGHANGHDVSNFGSEAPGEAPESQNSRGSAAHSAASAGLPPTHTQKAARKRYSLEEKRRILRLVDACTERGQIAAILRREGIYYSTLNLFLEQREKGLLELGAKKAKKAQDEQKTALEREVAALKRDNRRLNAKLEKAEIIIDFQKKLSQLLGIEMHAPELNDPDPNDR
jgi:transposase